MSKITNDGLTRSGTGCWLYPYGNSRRQRGQRVNVTCRVDHVFNLLKPVRLDGVSKALHRCLEVTYLDLVLVLLVERLERVLGRCQIQPHNATTTTMISRRKIILGHK